MATPIYISFHAMLGLLGIRSGFAVMLQFLTGKRLTRLPVLFSDRLFFPLVFLVTISCSRFLKDRVHLRVENPLKEDSSWQEEKSVLASSEQMCATAGGATPTFRP